jgi:hypothetical protein
MIWTAVNDNTTNNESSASATLLNGDQL